MGSQIQTGCDLAMLRIAPENHWDHTQDDD